MNMFLLYFKLFVLGVSLFVRECRPAYAPLNQNVSQ